MKPKRKAPKVSLEAVVEDLRHQGYQPNFHDGRLVDWRRVRNHKLQMATVTVHTSGRVTTTIRSRVDGKDTGRKRDNQEGRAA